MFNKPLMQVQNVSASGGVATLRIAPEQATLVGIKFKLGGGGTLDTSKISRVRVKVGPRVIWDLTGAQLLAINAYKGGTANTAYLYLDFTERDQSIFPVKEIGGLDLMRLLPVGEVFIELTVAAATTPTIYAQGYFERAQGNGAVLKYLPYSWTQSASGKFNLPLNFRGALLKRLWNQYTGTDFTGTTDGNITRMECKKNGLPFFDEFCTDARFQQAQFKKVPQSRFFVADFIVNNDHDSHISTMRKENTPTGQIMVYDSFEFNAFLLDGAGSTVTAIAEVLDAVTNL